MKSDEFVTIMKKFIEESRFLTHLDLSGMGLIREWSVVIASACV